MPHFANGNTHLITSSPMLRKYKIFPDNLLFVMFFISGFCSLLYQIIWIRLTFSNFGVITPVISVILSVFMLGLSLGSWLGGKYILRISQRFKKSPIVFYALAETVIGIGAFVVPILFQFGKALLQQAGESDSFSFLIMSAIMIAVSIFPWCICMGVTFPFMMGFVKEIRQSDTHSFSFLYLANVIGAMFGILITVLFFIEIFGFQATLWIAGIVNFALAVTAYLIGRQYSHVLSTGQNQEVQEIAFSDRSPQSQGVPLSRLILFMTGFVSIAMEVVWTRLFTPVLGTQVYAFAGPLFIYLLATWIGSLIYRSHLARRIYYSPGGILILAAITSFFPIILNDPQLIPFSYRTVFIYISIFPFCSLLGYLTPYLIDDYSKGVPDRAGTAYAFNVIGSIFGSLIAGYLLLPLLGGRYTLIMLSLPLAFLAFNAARYFSIRSKFAATAFLVIFILSGSFYSRSYEVPESGDYIVRRDHTATVVTSGSGRERRLLVNGVTITELNPLTKFMAHLPLAFHKGEPSDALVICFGMGTTYRSLVSWNINVTAVELAPSVLRAFEEYHEDAAAYIAYSKGKLIVDDGRRYLERTEQKYDVIAIDPPPPVESAGSSLLYSDEFYDLIKKRLKPNGILQQWFPNVSGEILAAGERTLVKNFPYIKLYKGWKGYGWHYLVSMSPIDSLTAEDISQRLPARAQQDLLEWSEGEDIETYIQEVIKQERPVTEVPNGISPLITDDRPYNEYFWTRRWKHVIEQWINRRFGT